MQPFTIKHIDHIVLRVKDLERSITFFTERYSAPNWSSAVTTWAWCICVRAPR